MTQDEIIRLAVGCQLLNASNREGLYAQALERFADLVSAHEREACAKVADGELMNTNMLTSYPPKSSAAWNIAAAIRARGNNK